jgi:hypothetical protein
LGLLGFADRVHDVDGDFARNRWRYFRGRFYGIDNGTDRLVNGIDVDHGDHDRRDHHEHECQRVGDGRKRGCVDIRSGRRGGF